MGQTTLIVADRSRAATSLESVLRREHVPVEVVTPDEVRGWLAASPEDTGLVLVSAALDAATVRAVQAAVAASGPFGEVVVFAEPGAATDLGPHVRAGLDYLVPPFSSGVLLSRLARCTSDPAHAIKNAAHLAQYEKELQIGREIQAGFLPDVLPSPDGWQIEVRFHPARQVAGDFYDAFDLVNGRRVGFVVADVCDKGVGAALFMALIRSLLRNTASHSGSMSVVNLDVEWDAAGDDPSHRPPPATSAGIGPLLNAVTGTDRYMIQNHLFQGYFATLFFGMLDPSTGSVVYINCGHNPPVVRRRDGTQVTLEPTGPALGMMPDSHFRLGWVQLELGDLLFLYTDGVTEAKDENGRFFGEPTMRAVVDEPAHPAADELLDRLDSRLRAHIGEAEQFDDITMMALYRDPRPSSAMGAAAGPPVADPGSSADGTGRAAPDGGFR